MPVDGDGHRKVIDPYLIDPYLNLIDPYLNLIDPYIIDGDVGTVVSRYTLELR